MARRSILSQLFRQSAGYVIDKFNQKHSFFSGYSSDDINKFLWMVRIGGNTELGAHIKEADYYTPTGEFRVDREGSQTLLNCMMYKMSYYKFGQVYTDGCKSTLIIFTIMSLLHEQF